MSIAWLAALALAAQASEKPILAELERLDRSLATAETRLRETETQRDRLQKEIASIEAELAATNVREREAFSALKRRVRALGRMPAGARLVLLGGSRTLADYLRTTRVLRWVAAHDRRLRDHHVAEAKRLSDLEGAMTARRDELRELEKGLRSTRDELAQRRQERVSLLETVLREKATASRAYSERRAARKALASMIGKLVPAGRQARSFAGNKGRLPWPVAGTVDVAFGAQVEREFGTVTTQNGLDIRAPSGSHVQAVADGRVAYADWLRGYGQLVIVDHGAGYHTLYAHLASLTVARDQAVKQGAQVGTVGDTGSLRGTLLYFELREKSVAVDPARWLR